MCGRYTLVHSTNEIIERFQVMLDVMDSPVIPRYNIAPTQQVPIVVPGTAKRRKPKTDAPAAAEADYVATASGDTSSNSDGDTNTNSDGENPDGKRLLQFARWGLVPFWVTDDPKKMKPLINARVETLVEKASFRNALGKRRCLIPADGFYEWRTIEGKKIPVRIRLTGERLFAFAGLYEDWKSPDGNYLRSCTIVTVSGNEKLASVHDRMPAILHPEHEETWLMENDKSKLMSLLQPYQDDEIEFYTVSTVVNSASKDLPECVEPVAEQLRIS